MTGIGPPKNTTEGQLGGVLPAGPRKVWPWSRDQGLFPIKLSLLPNKIAVYGLFVGTLIDLGVPPGRRKVILAIR